jgi:hypothetical protein
VNIPIMTPVGTRDVISLPGAGAIVLTVRCASSRPILFEDPGIDEALPSRFWSSASLGFQPNIGTIRVSPWIEFPVGLPAAAVVMTLLTLWIVAVDRGYL